MNKQILIGLLVIPIVWPVATSADWQYTHWNMTPEQVIAASQGTAQATSKQEHKNKRLGSETPLLKAKWISGELQFVAYFYFNSNKLTTVSLELQNPEHEATLVRSLKLKYGEPKSERRLSVARTMTWRTAMDTIGFIKVTDGPPEVRYSPRSTANTKGL
jgi:hypothetical protein